jgi:hypothetical protein
VTTPVERFTAFVNGERGPYEKFDADARALLALVSACSEVEQDASWDRIADAMNELQGKCCGSCDAHWRARAGMMKRIEATLATLTTPTTGRGG